MNVTIEKIERLRERADVGYEEAKAALEAADGNLLDAIIALERDGKLGPNAGSRKTAAYSTNSGYVSSAVGETYGAGSAPQVSVNSNFTADGEQLAEGKATKAGKADKKAKNKGSQPGDADSRHSQYSQYDQYGQGRPGGAYNTYDQPGGPHRYEDETSDFEDGINRFFSWIGRAFRAGLNNYFEVWRSGGRVIYFPVILFLFCLIPWVFWVTVVFLIIGLCCRCSYRFSGPNLGRKNADDGMNRE